MKRFLVAAALLTSFAVFADDDLKPAQEEAKEKFENEMADSLKAMNEKCGTKLSVTVDWKNFSASAVEGISVSGYAQDALVNALSSLCDRPAYKKIIAKKVTGLKFNLAGGKPQGKESSTEHSQAHFKFDKGVFSYTFEKSTSNLSDNGKAVLEKAFN